MIDHRSRLSMPTSTRRPLPMDEMVCPSTVLHTNQYTDPSGKEASNQAASKNRSTRLRQKHSAPAGGRPSSSTFYDAVDFRQWQVTRKRSAKDQLVILYSYIECLCAWPFLASRLQATTNLLDLVCACLSAPVHVYLHQYMHIMTVHYRTTTIPSALTCCSSAR
jgi:hypothetical protein